MISPLQQLTNLAKDRMNHSPDPAHDLLHSKRVVANVKHISGELHLKKYQCEALVLAAWWHDVSRTLFKHPSFIWMPLIDDTLSAILLWRNTRHFYDYDKIASLATRLILCKSLGTGAFLTRLILRKKHRLLVGVLRDADVLDTLNVDRMKCLQELVESSGLYHTGYRFLIRWFTNAKHLRTKTDVARAYMVEQMDAFMTWIEDETNIDWHSEQFGDAWVERNLDRGRTLQHKMTR